MVAYTEVTISSYNATPPTDDGSTGAANEITWAGVKTKLGNPIKTAIEAIDDNVSSACASLDSSITTQNTAITTANTNLTTALTALYAPSGTITLFQQTAAPTLWTKLTTHDDKMLRLVSGTPSSGGGTAFTGVFAARTFTSSQMPAHTHTFSSSSNAISFSRTSFSTSHNEDHVNVASGGSSNPQNVSESTTAVTSISASVTLSGTTTAASTGSSIDFDIQYVDVTLASKD